MIRKTNASGEDSQSATIPSELLVLAVQCTESVDAVGWRWVSWW